MIKKTMTQILGRHLLEPFRYPKHAWKTKKVQIPLWTGCLLAVLFVANYYFYLGAYEGIGLLLGVHPPEVSATPLLFQNGTWVGVLSFYHVAAALTSLLMPMHRLLYELIWVRIRPESFYLDAWPPIEPNRHE